MCALPIFAQVAVTRSTSQGDANQLITAFATERLISRSLVAYRLFRGGRISENMWKGLAATFRTEWLQNRAAQRERARGQDGGPNYYIEIGRASCRERVWQYV